MKRLFLLGEKLGHSLSPRIHEAYLRLRGQRGSYGLREVARRDLTEIRSTSGDADGFNVTVPYKEAVVPLLDEADAVARAVGAVNTVAIRGGRWLGHNTDVEGFSALLERFGIEARRRCVVLGGGGAAKSAVYALLRSGAEQVLVASGDPGRRRTEFARKCAFDDRVGFCGYAERREFYGDLVVNATPVGMAPHAGVSPLDAALLSNFGAAVDLIYNPSMTRFLQDASAAGKRAVNGLYMLVAQALSAQAFWYGEGDALDYAEAVYREVKRGFDANSGGNIYLIGMMASGKSTVGRALAALTGRQFVDCDAAVEARTCMTIPALFARGEDYFRAEERAALTEIARQGNRIVACGGGAVLRAENRDLLRLTGTAVWIRRSAAALKERDRRDRPLLASGADAEEIYRARKPLYEDAADLTVDNTATPEDCARAIARQLGIIEG